MVTTQSPLSKKVQIIRLASLSPQERLRNDVRHNVSKNWCQARVPNFLRFRMKRRIFRDHWRSLLVKGFTKTFRLSEKSLRTTIESSPSFRIAFYWGFKGKEEALLTPFLWECLVTWDECCQKISPACREHISARAHSPRHIMRTSYALLIVAWIQSRSWAQTRLKTFSLKAPEKTLRRLTFLKKLRRRKCSSLFKLKKDYDFSKAVLIYEIVWDY